MLTMAFRTISISYVIQYIDTCKRDINLYSGANQNSYYVLPKMAQTIYHICNANLKMFVCKFYDYNIMFRVLV